MENIEALYPLYEHSKPKEAGRYSYDTKRPFLMAMSAHDKTTLLGNIDAHSRVALDYHIPDLAYTLSERRSKFKERGFTIMSEERHLPSIRNRFELALALASQSNSASFLRVKEHNSHVWATKLCKLFRASFRQ